MDDKEILMKNAYEKLEAAKTLYENDFYGDAVSRAYYASQSTFIPKRHLSKNT